MNEHLQKNNEFLPGEDAKIMNEAIKRALSGDSEELILSLKELKEKNLLSEFCLRLAKLYLRKDEHKKVFDEMDKTGILKIVGIINFLLEEKKQYDKSRK